ncbi:MAG: DsrE/DsrF/DrsH-like family protein [Solibacillus sp.]
MSNKVAIIASNGGLFDAYKVFNIATAAAATDKEVQIFFTFEGLNLIHKQAMHALEMPAGKEHFAQGFADANVPSIPQLVEMAQELGVKFIACQMTMDVMGLTSADFVEDIEVGGAVTFLEFAKEATPTLTF